jgi:hypothetical protein
MGTSFYWTNREPHTEEGNPVNHIGKRSAAGQFCWDCMVSLCKDVKTLHEGYAEWHETCPNCWQEPVDPSMDKGAVAVELGYAKPEEERPMGVQTCFSFTWAHSPERTISKCMQHPQDTLVVDEYGREYTGYQFLRMLECNCPIRYYGSIGRWFS